MKTFTSILFALIFMASANAQTGWDYEYVTPEINTDNFIELTENGNITVDYFGGASPIPINELFQGGTIKIDVILPPGCTMAMLSAQSNDWQGMSGQTENWVAFSSQFLVNYYLSAPILLTQAGSFMGDPSARPSGNTDTAEVYRSDLHVAGGGCNEQLYSGTTLLEPKWGYFLLSNPALNNHSFTFSTMTFTIAIDSMELYNEWVNMGMPTPEEWEGWTSTKEINDEDIEFVVFPNPASNNLQLTINNEQLGENIQIIDISGSILKQFKIHNLENSIQIDDLQNGIYFVKIGNYVQKFIKE